MSVEVALLQGGTNSTWLIPICIMLVFTYFSEYCSLQYSSGLNPSCSIPPKPTYNTACNSYNHMQLVQPLHASLWLSIFTFIFVSLHSLVSSFLCFTHYHQFTINSQTWFMRIHQPRRYTSHLALVFASLSQKRSAYIIFSHNHVKNCKTYLLLKWKSYHRQKMCILWRFTIHYRHKTSSYVWRIHG